MGEIIGASVLSFIVFRIFKWAISFIKRLPSSSCILISGILTCSLLTASGSVNFGLGKAFLLYGLTAILWTIGHLGALRNGPKIAKSMQANLQTSQSRSVDPLARVFDSEADRIQYLVDQRQKEAEKKGIRKLTEDIYFECANYPTLLNNSQRDSVPAVVVEASKGVATNSDASRYEILRIKLNTGELRFDFGKTSDYDGIDYGKLQLQWNNDAVLILGMSRESSEGNRYSSAIWKSFKIESYIPGAWEDALLLLKTEAASLKIELERKRKEDPKKIDDLKRKFGLE